MIRMYGNDLVVMYFAVGFFFFFEGVLIFQWYILKYLQMKVPQIIQDGRKWLVVDMKLGLTMN